MIVMRLKMNNGIMEKIIIVETLRGNRYFSTNLYPLPTSTNH